jgi:hypothetical protein
MQTVRRRGLAFQMVRDVDDDPFFGGTVATIEQYGFQQQSSLVVQEIVPPACRNYLRQNDNGRPTFGFSAVDFVEVLHQRLNDRATG